MRKFIGIALAMMLCAFAAGAQIVTTSPEILQESSRNVVLTYHADSPLGNNGLKGLTSATPVYAHVGVITNKSNNEWVYGPTKWGDNDVKYKLNYVSANTWTLNIGDMRTYFGITDASEHVERIALVFRTGDCTKEGKTASGGDIFVDVFPEGFQMLFSHNATSLVIQKTTAITFTAVTSQPANISVSVNGTNIGSASNQSKYAVTHTFSATGNYEVKATATAGGKTVTKTLNVAYPAPSQAGTYPGGVPKMGAVRNSDGTVTFCLAAPGKSSVVLVPSWDNYQVLAKNSMKYQDYNGQRYFFTTVSGLDNTSYYPYYYIVDGLTKVGDPYARMVLDPYSDKWIENPWPGMPKYPYDKFDDVMLAVYKGDFDSDFDFDPFTIPDKNTLTIYELLIRDFNGTDGQALGDGTIASMHKRLQYLKYLGVNAIELMPVMEFNGNNSWGYNTNFYMALDKAYGSPRQLKTFVNECHKMGIAVILDIVFNQSDGLHPWYQMYPVSSNPFYNQTAPHAYSVLNDWKQENPLVQQQWKDALQFWLKTYNVDGFRFDLVKGLGTSYGSDTDGYNASRVQVMKNLHAAMKAVKPDAIHINENLAQTREENEMAADGQLNWANINYHSRQYAKGQASGASLARFLSSNDGGRTAFSTIGYAESHDEERVGYDALNNGVTAIRNKVPETMKRLGQVAVQMLLTPGPKMIWQFGELGADQSTKSGNNNNTDPKTVVWNYENNADRKALQATYGALCNLRTDNPEMFGPGVTFETTGISDNVSTMRTMRLVNGNKEILAFINPTTNTTKRAIQGPVGSKINASNCQLITASKDLGISTVTMTGNRPMVQIPGNSYVVFATRDVAGVDDIIADGDADADAPVIYYNLQGVRVAGDNLAPGLYIRHQGSKTSKVLVR